MDRTVVEDQNEGPGREPELGTIAPIDLLQESDKVRASLGPAGVSDQIATRPVEPPEHGPFRPLARGRNAQIGPFLRPDMRQIGMSEDFGLVREQKHDIARLGLSLSNLRRRPARSTAFASWRPLSVWRGRRQRKSLFGAAPRTAVSGRCAHLSAFRSRLLDAAASSSGGPPPAQTGPPRPRPARARP